MKSLQIGGLIVGVAVIGVGMIMAITNPNQAAYDEYAIAQLSTYLKETGCSRSLPFVGTSFQDECVSLVQNNQPQIRQLISQSTDRQNYFILSVYKTELSADTILPPAVSQLIPSYHFETIGVFQNFYTYKAEQQR